MAVERQHYVPRGYLKGFSVEDPETDSFVWAYEKLAGRRPRKVSVKSVCWESYYYEQEREDGSPDTDGLENKFAVDIENVVLPIIKNIKPVVGSPIIISEEDRGKLAFFLGITMTRVPSFRAPMKKYFSRIAQIGLEYVTRKDPSIRDFTDKYGVYAEAKSWASLKPMVKIAEIIGLSALEKNWQFFIPPKESSLVTSDNPLVFSINKVYGDALLIPAHPKAELIMNLRKDLALVCTPIIGYPNGMVFNINDYETRKFNRGVVRAARRYVFCDHYSPQMDSFVKKYAGQEQTILVD